MRIATSLFILVILATACTTSQPSTNSQVFVDGMSDDQFNEISDHFTKKEEKYNGFTSSFKFYATILNSKVRDAQVARKASDYQWTRESLFQEREKDTQSLNSESQIFLSFFAPENENDNLESSKTLWKVYLFSEGARFEPRITKTAGPLAQFQRLYSFHTRYMTPYILTFKVPMSKVQQTESKLVITGPVGTSEVTFPSISQ